MKDHFCIENPATTDDDKAVDAQAQTPVRCNFSKIKSWTDEKLLRCKGFKRIVESGIVYVEPPYDTCTRCDKKIYYSLMHANASNVHQHALQQTVGYIRSGHVAHPATTEEPPITVHEHVPKGPVETPANDVVMHIRALAEYPREHIEFDVPASWVAKAFDVSIDLVRRSTTTFFTGLDFVGKDGVAHFRCLSAALQGHGWAFPTDLKGGYRPVSETMASPLVETI